MYCEEDYRKCCLETCVACQLPIDLPLMRRRLTRSPLARCLEISADQRGLKDHPAPRASARAPARARAGGDVLMLYRRYDV